MRYTRMTSFALHRRASLIEELNFLLTNRVSRRALRWFMGWLSKIEQPMVRDLSLAVWRLFTKLDLGGSYQLFSWLSAYGQAENLTDSQHIAPIGYPSLPFNFRAGLKLQLGKGSR